MHPVPHKSCSRPHCFAARTASIIIHIDSKNSRFKFKPKREGCETELLKLLPSVAATVGAVGSAAPNNAAIVAAIVGAVAAAVLGGNDMQLTPQSMLLQVVVVVVAPQVVVAPHSAVVAVVLGTIHCRPEGFLDK